MIGVLTMTQTFAHFILGLQIVLLYLSWKGVQRYDDVSGVSDLLKLDVGHLLVVDISWVMSWNESWEFGDVTVRSHF